MRSTSGFKISPNPPVEGQAAIVTVPHTGPWYVYVTNHTTGALTELGPLTATTGSVLELDIPAGTGGDTLTITDEREPLPNDADYPIVSTD